MAAAIALASSPCADVGFESATSAAPFHFASTQQSAASAIDGNGGKLSHESVRASLAALIPADNLEEVGARLNVTSDDDSGASHDTFEARSFSSRDGSEIASQETVNSHAAAATDCASSSHTHGEVAQRLSHFSEIRVNFFDSAEPRGDENAAGDSTFGPLSHVDEGNSESHSPLETDSMLCTEIPGETGWERVRRALEEKAVEQSSNVNQIHAIDAAGVRELVAENALPRLTSNYGAAELLQRMQTEGEEVTDDDWDGAHDSPVVVLLDEQGRWDSGGAAPLDVVCETPRNPAAPPRNHAAAAQVSAPQQSASRARDAATPSSEIAVTPEQRDSPSPKKRQAQRDFQSPCTPRSGTRVRPRWQMDSSQLVIRNFLARGSFGTVHRGQYKGRDVAVKLLNWTGESVHRGAGAAGKIIGARNGENAGGAAGAVAAAGPTGEAGRGEKEGVKVAGKPEAVGKINSADLAFLRDVFAQEVLVWSKLRHKNICEFVGATIGGHESYDLTSTVKDHQGQLRVGSDCCLVLEFLPGGTLKQLLAKHSRKKKRLPLERALRLALQVAEGLKYLHSCNIVHRDLKTDNLLLDQKHRVVKIADFGVSRVQPGDRTMKRRTGTYGYMAPEVLKEQPYDHMADVYSFGIVLWEIVTCGNPFPFEGLKPEQVCSMVNQGLRPDIPSWCPAPLSALMRQCWHRSPASRPDMGEVVERLTAVTLQCATVLPACICM
ncbi:hypothetical protein CLOM_g22015 [Closterium sp. NIES-68]|nr:hypothetical protein CLOM_g22015 [Closterium sp. NIES-68]GJP77808.1 hypothetical protein CLOP_g8147 [Closterium sp. NIES-67]